MRGILLLALGGALIWFGVSLGGRQDGARGPIYAGDSDGAPSAGGAALVLRGEQSGPDLDPAPEEKAIQEPEPDPPLPEAPVVPVEEPEPAAEPAAQPAALGVVLPQVIPVRTLNSSDELVALTTPSAMVETLARVLLESWLRGDPTSLQALLNDEQQAIPPELHSLTVQFWETLVQAASAPLRDLTNGDAEGPREVLLASVPHVQAGGQVPVVQTTGDPMAHAMRMILLMEAMGRADQEGQSGRTSQIASELMDLELGATWSPHRETLLDWSGTLNEAQEGHRLHPDGVWSSLPYMVESGDNLVGIRKKFVNRHPELRLCVGMLRWVNATGEYLHPGQTLRIPTDVPSVDVYLDARLLVYRHGSEIVRAWDIGIGKVGHDTPLGEFEIGDKESDPSFPGNGELLPHGHPDNPLGTRWLGWHRGGEKSSFGIHGTREPEGVGDRVSQGCVRMRNVEVEELFELLPRGARIRVHP
ncbi:MAG TPA: L,D-transpeptidase [Planctomycetes bacterium]|nr:L,D-transpeptidase [Planctomycetota bacterium]